MSEATKLKEFQRAHRDNWGAGLSLRVHRAISWLARAEQERGQALDEGDSDAEFIFLWISFNAAYANEYDAMSRDKTRDLYTAFFERLVGLDNERQLYNIIWQQYSSTVRSLLDNQYVYQPFWDCEIGKREPDCWQESFEQAKEVAKRALAKQDVVTVWSIVMDRLYTLRNQLIHGGATWNGSWNRDQLRDATRLLGELMPVVIQLMMDNAHLVWGDAGYFVGDKD